MAAIPEILRPILLRWKERAGENPDLAARCAALTEAARQELERVVVCSEFVAAAVLRDPSIIAAAAAPASDEYTATAPAGHAFAPARDAPPILTDPLPGIDAVSSALRVWRRREMAVIAWRDIASRSSVPETLQALSLLADRAIAAAVGAAQRELAKIFGAAVGESKQPANFIVLGMGKLGGGELNFSSDIDLIFLYSEGGETTGPRVIDNGEYFNRLGQEVIRLLDANTEAGFVFRVDMRLRPFGQSGPLSVSVSALEDYLQQHGRDWERYAWIKARAIVGAEHYFDVYSNFVRPFVYRRYLDFGVFESLRDMKAMIEREVTRRDLQQHLKLGRGGIREIEFIMQSFQLVRGGSDMRLQGPSLLRLLPLLAGSKLLSEAIVTDLAQAYTVLRKAENGLQMIRDAQVHTLPDDVIDRERLAMMLNAADWPAAAHMLEQARDRVAFHFDALVFGGQDAGRADAQDTLAWLGGEGAGFEDELRAVGFPDAETAAAAAALLGYRNSGTFKRLDETASRRVRTLLARLLKRVRQLAAPALTLQRVLRVLESIGSRAAYLALLNEHSAALDRLIDTCAISGFLTRQIAEFPLLLDELLDSRLFEELPSRAGFAAELAARMERVPIDDPERQIEALREFQKAAVFAVALADLTQRLPLMKVSDRLTDIAELIVKRCMDLAWDQMTASYGTPRCGSAGEPLRVVNIATAGYGKLGGIELGYGSDLDLVFLHDSSGDIQQTDGDRSIDNGVFFLRLGQRIVHLLTFHSAAGRLYEVDMRLRPNGKGGFLMTGIEAFERYQREEAWTWEHQALLRARAVAGDATLRERFETVRRRILIDAVHRDRLREDVAHMRARMRSELSKAKDGEFDIKQDAGGIADIEFLVQFWALSSAPRHPDVIEFTDNIRQLEALARDGIVAAATAVWLIDAYRGYRAVLHHLSLEGAGDRVVERAPHEEVRAGVIKIWDEVFGPA